MYYAPEQKQTKSSPTLFRFNSFRRFLLANFVPLSCLPSNNFQSTYLALIVIVISCLALYCPTLRLFSAFFFVYCLPLLAIAYCYCYLLPCAYCYCYLLPCAYFLRLLPTLRSIFCLALIVISLGS